MPLRMREMGSTYFSPNTWTTSSNPGPTNTTSSVSGARLGEYQIMWDTVTPNFNRLRAEGQVFNNPVTRQKATYTTNLSGYGHSILVPPPSGVVRGSTPSLLHTLVGPLAREMGTVTPNILSGWTPHVDVARLKTLAANQAAANSSGKAAQGMVITAELQKTMAALKNPFGALRNMMKRIPSQKYRKGSNSKLAVWTPEDMAIGIQAYLPGKRFPKNNRILPPKEWFEAYSTGKVVPRGTIAPRDWSMSNIGNGLSSQYLTWFYGIRTTMFDIEDVLEALHKPISNRVTTRGRADEVYSSQSVSGNLAVGSVMTDVRMTTYFSEYCEVRAGALFEHALETSNPARLGFSVRKIPAAVWELTPWSFVVDWFVNVGQLIDAYEGYLCSNYKAEWVTTKYELRWLRRITNVTVDSAWYVDTPCSDEDLVVVETYDRVPEKLWPYIGARFNFTLDKVPVLAAVSLAVQQLTKGR